jgi:hypothetical protein
MAFLQRLHGDHGNQFLIVSCLAPITYSLAKCSRIALRVMA